MKSADFALPGSPEFEDRKLQYLNASARIGGMSVDKQRKAQGELDDKYPDIIAALTPKLLPPKRRTSPPEEGSIIEFVLAHGALAVCLAALPELTEEEFGELGAAAAELHFERNPEAKLSEVEAIADRMSNRVGVPVRAIPESADNDELHFIADEAGAYANPDETLTKFAKGDKLFISEPGFMQVVGPIPDDYATMKVPAAASIAIGLGMPKELKSKVEVMGWLAERVAARDAEIAAIPDEQSKLDD